MAITRVNPGDWAVGEKLTSAQANGLDTNSEKAVDKTIAGDTVSGELTFDTTGSIVLESGANILAEAGSSVAIEGELAAPGTATIDLTLGANGHIDVATGGQISTSGGSLYLGSGTWPTLNSRTRVTGEPPGFLACMSTFETATGLWQQPNSSGSLLGGATIYPVTLRFLPHNAATLTGITLYFTPAAHGSLPASNVGMSLSTYSIATGSLLFTSSATYTPGLLASYSATRQTFTLSLSQVIDTASNFYVIRVTDENGGGSVSGGVFDFLKLTYTVTDMRFP